MHHARGAADAEHALRQPRQHAAHGYQAALLLFDRRDHDAQVREARAQPRAQLREAHLVARPGSSPPGTRAWARTASRTRMSAARCARAALCSATKPWTNFTFEEKRLGNAGTGVTMRFAKGDLDVAHSARRARLAGGRPHARLAH